MCVVYVSVCVCMCLKNAQDDAQFHLEDEGRRRVLQLQARAKCDAERSCNQNQACAETLVDTIASSNRSNLLWGQVNRPQYRFRSNIPTPDPE